MRNKTKVLLLLPRKLIIESIAYLPGKISFLSWTPELGNTIPGPRSSMHHPSWDSLRYHLGTEMERSAWLWELHCWWSWQGLLMIRCGWWRKGGKPGWLLHFQSGEFGGCGAIYRDWKKKNEGWSKSPEREQTNSVTTEWEPTTALLDHRWALSSAGLTPNPSLSLNPVSWCPWLCLWSPRFHR